MRSVERRQSIDCRRLYDLFTGDPSEYRSFIDATFHQRVQSVLLKVPFYRDQLRAHGWTADHFRTIGSLSKLPILERHTLQIVPIDRFLNSTIKPNDLPPASYTSGTSGNPLKLYASRDFYVSSFHILQRSHGGSVPFRVACVSEDDRVLPLTDECQVYFVSRKHTTAKLYARLVELELQGVMMRPDRWRLLIDSYGDDLGRLGITFAGVSGAATTRGERAYFSSVLRCPVVNMYGATELGGGIFECPAGREHVLAHQNHLEVVDDDGRAVGPGNVGHLIWSTLDNTIMPLIRYKIGDMGALSKRQACTCGWNGPIIDAIEPRTKEGVVFPSGMKTSFHLFNVEIHRNQGTKQFRQYRLIQERVDLVRLVAVKSRSFNEPDACGLLTRLRDLLRGEIVLEVEYVDQIEQAGNKFEHFIPLNTP